MSHRTPRKLRKHAIKRGQQRFGNIDARIIKELEKAIRAGKSLYVKKQTNRVSVHDITYEGRVYRCVYDNELHAIRTLLTTNMKV